MTSNNSAPRIPHDARMPASAGRVPLLSMPPRPVTPALRAQWRELQRSDRYGRFGGR